MKTATAIPTRLPTAQPSIVELVRRARRPLPAHDLADAPFRKWAVAVCTAEVAHRSADVCRIERALGFSLDRNEDPRCEERGQFLHEARAGVALVWLSHLQTHESEKRTPFSAKPWRQWSPAARTAWLARRRYLWSGFLKAVRAYRDARAPIDQLAAA